MVKTNFSEMVSKHLQEKVAKRGIKCYYIADGCDEASTTPLGAMILATSLRDRELPVIREISTEEVIERAASCIRDWSKLTCSVEKWHQKWATGDNAILDVTDYDPNSHRIVEVFHDLVTIDGDELFSEEYINDQDNNNGVSPNVMKINVHDEIVPLYLSYSPSRESYYPADCYSVRCENSTVLAQGCSVAECREKMRILQYSLILTRHIWKNHPALEGVQFLVE